MSDHLRDKYVAVTGASGGIGREIALKAAERGAHLILLARSEERLKQLRQEIITRYRVEAYVYKLDVGDLPQVEKVFTRVLSEVGRIDILVNNAGFGVFKDAHETDLEEARTMFDVNVLGLAACTKMVLPHMKVRKSGHIINIASQAGKIASPKSSIYSATKHAVLGYTNSLRLELADDRIFVTSVNPGPIATNFFAIADESGTYVKNVQRFMLKPDFVAEKVVNSMLTKKREINLPGWMNLGSIFFSLFPKTFERVGKKFIFKK
ncbi:short-subunit dehydrogenase [Peribacillus deserti]|uniref:Short-subunit dehydrogenase n=1 Tax=Peribacillus deserti TaxID=673318 RepID=A0ABS2QJ89_9BACI|nr:SDR family oxidoreductase [Peribacillus deserti]MBM7693204.1 short-subunit dehydrogenase [Peribacillus deserti]